MRNAEESFKLIDELRNKKEEEFNNALPKIFEAITMALCDNGDGTYRINKADIVTILNCYFNKSDEFNRQDFIFQKTRIDNTLDNFLRQYETGKYQYIRSEKEIYDYKNNVVEYWYYITPECKEDME